MGADASQVVENGSKRPLCAYTKRLVLDGHFLVSGVVVAEFNLESEF